MVKTISALTTFIILAIIICLIKVLDNPELAFGVPLLSLLIGFIMRYQKTNPVIQKTGTGIFYSSLICLLLLGAFLIWLSYNWPK